MLLFPKENVKGHVVKLVEENIQPTKEAMAFEAVRSFRSKGIARDCPDDKGAQRLLQLIQTNEKLAGGIERKKTPIRFPRCIVYDIPKGMEDIEVSEALELATGVPKGSLKPCFRIKESRNIVIWCSQRNRNTS
ncbi:hypothetical protein AVEN_126586-1 [Araneus ventricosus]|uniref:Uncharacterized protein n=1 Tax=Araneus ventricosus TaxID=182803 RepID=A0A4Y2IA90_ARAVE|nr:hypothetical protein AVEN_126586-1 [Araneus ventricosus]